MPLECIDTTKLENADKLDVLVVGNSSREHALTWKLKQSERIGRLCIAPAKAGLEDTADSLPLAMNASVQEVAQLACDEGFDYVVVSQDAWLAAGLVDALAERNIPAFGPTRSAFRIESDKVYAKQKMRTYGVPTADYAVFRDARAAHEYIDQQIAFPLFVKAFGPAAGKGAKRAGSATEAHAHTDDLLVRQSLGSAGDIIIIEAFSPGQEASLFAFSDGQHSLPLISAQDHKQILAGDRGEMTGGTGAIARVPWLNDTLVKRAHNSLTRPVLEGMYMEKNPFTGMSYTGIKTTASGLSVVMHGGRGDLRGPDILEYNARPGCPDSDVQMVLLKSDLLELMVATNLGTLDKHSLEWSDDYAVMVVAMSSGYPSSGYTIGHPIEGLNAKGQLNDGVVIFHGGTREHGGHFYTNGGRVLGVVATGATLELAIDTAYANIEKINFLGMYYRHDIGQRPHPE